MPSSQFSHSTTAASTLEHAWQQLQVPETWESIPGVDDVVDAHHEPDGTLLGYRFFAMAGGTKHEGSAQVRLAERPTQMILDIQSRELGGWIRTDLSNTAESVIEISVTVHLESRGFLSGIFFSLLSKIIRDGLPESVEAFAARLAET